MAVSQISPGRISNSLQSQRIVDVLSQNQNTISRIQTQLGTGKKFLLPSEAPTAATQTLVLQKLDERRAAFQQSVQTNQGFLATADQTLTLFSDALSQARGIVQAAAGDQITSQEREGLILEVSGLIQSLIQAGNTQYAGRYLFAGTATDAAPFESAAGGVVRYRGNTQVLAGYADFGLLIDTGIDGGFGLGAVTDPESSDLNPALTLGTLLSDLYSGAGVNASQIRVTLVDGANTVDRTIDLSTAETVQDLKTQIESAFAAEAITVTVEIDPGSQNGLRITPSAGTVRIRDLESGNTAQQLGIASDAAAVINGADLDPAVTLSTAVASLNNNTGIGATAGTGLRIVNGGRTSIVDLNGAATVQDVLNRIRDADDDLLVDFSADGRGIAVSSRLSGSDFSIGENGGSNATNLGLRTFTAGARLDDLNLGQGIPREGAPPLRITRRDGTVTEVNLQTALTVQEVLDAINAADPGVLTASLNFIGNGISLVDTSGVGTLSVESSGVSQALGLDGSNNGGAAGVLAGRDVHPRQAQGVFSLLVGLQQAIRDRDLPELERLAAGLDSEAARVAVVRGGIGIQERQLDSIDNLLSDRHVEVQSQLEKLIDIDYAETITSFTAHQQALEAYLQVAAQTQQLSLLNFL
ncbi:MAG: flagellin [Planctomycetaceae bacterium]|nr:flagellin [Planctomycetaceae bacterium]